MTVLADESWYTTRDGRRKLSPHCPLAANDKCPRYYLSQRYAADSGDCTQELPTAVKARIEELWAASDVFASIEQSVGMWQARDGRFRGISGFCPEVTARVFGLYCSDLRTYPDDEARRSTHKQLVAEDADMKDPRWNWMVVEPRHYSQCHEFSVYGSGQSRLSSKPAKGRRSLPPKLRFAVFARDGWRCVYCGKSAADSILHVDHRISVVNGGDDSLENLATACEECNLGKGAANADDA